MKLRGEGGQNVCVRVQARATGSRGECVVVVYVVQQKERQRMSADHRVKHKRYPTLRSAEVLKLTCYYADLRDDPLSSCFIKMSLQNITDRFVLLKESNPHIFRFKICRVLSDEETHGCKPKYAVTRGRGISLLLACVCVRMFLTTVLMCHRVLKGITK